ncbi:hypothetical protein MKZ21_24800 [Paenibacillus sp. FSL P2-0536]|uniref:hypothetical protein n=1 Tax=Paenibacillus TaxID=44249 RepID=UPI000ACB24FC|nr:hypothetical protein [Paenibacillus odorifer]
MEYIEIYHTGTSNNTKLARLEAEDITAAIEKTNTIFRELWSQRAFFVRCLTIEWD